MKSTKTTNLYQFQRLVDELKKMPQMAKGVPVSHMYRKQYEDGWEEIKEMLNFLGPPTRSTAEWKKVWADLRTRTKRKLAEIERELRRTDDGPALKVALTPLEQDVEHLLNQIEVVQKPATSVTRPQKRQCKEVTPALSSHPTDPLQSSADNEDEELTVAAFDEASSDDSSHATTSRPKRSRTNEDEYLVLLKRQNNLLEENTKALGRIAEAIERLF